MGAFLLLKQNAPGFAASAALEVFEQMGLKAPHEFHIAGYKCWSYKKIRSEEDHFIVSGNSLLVCAGTAIYQGSNELQHSLQLILNDLRNGTFNYNKIRGSYTLIYSGDGNSIKLLTDQAGIANIYFDTNADIISSSFMAVIFGMQKKLTLNKFAAAEVITCGRQIGPDTLFNEIARVEISLVDKVGEIEIVKDKTALGFPEQTTVSFNKAVDEQIAAIDDYFKDIQQFGNNYGVDSGLTAGHDSRMMLIEIRKYFKNLQIHSFWRKTKDLELTIAEKVAETAGLQLRVIPGKHQLDKTAQQLEETLLKSLYFYDGHIRMHCFLMEDYHTIEHRSEILGDKKLGINGIGGEQYRNEWHMEMPSWSVDYFTKYALTYHLAGRCFTDSKFEAQYFDYLKTKLLKKLGLDINAKKISKKYVQKYYNEVYVASLMGVRTNAENVLGHFVTPFIDRQLTRTSYKALPHHGISFDFQQAMIRKMDPELASVQTGYGYSFTEGEPVKKKLKYLLKEFTPVGMYQNKLDKKFESSGNKDFQQYISNYKIFDESVKFMRSFNLPLDEKIFTSRPDIMPVYLSLAYFLYYLSKKDRLEIL
ncbi:hypothetical protein BH11BAC4_BH11BAC4_11580 [soil metagenome]